MADHNLGPTVGTGYNEVYLRYYYKASTNYIYGAQKMITINPVGNGAGGILIGGVAHPFGGSGEMLACPVWDCNGSRNNPQCRAPRCPSNSYYNQNVGPLSNVFDMNAIVGHWIYIEFHIKMNTPGVNDGIFELWMDDCGTSGLLCTGTPTLRSQYTNAGWQDASHNRLVGNFWYENWANIGSVGQEWYDQIIASRTGPIGFAGSAPDSPPSVTIDSPASGANFTASPISVTETATDTSPGTVTQVVTKMDGVTKCTDTTAPYTCDITVTAADNGSHTLTAEAKDDANQTTVSAAVPITVSIAVGDVTNPSVAMSSPANSSALSARTDIDATCTDNIAVASVAIRRSGQTLCTLTSPVTGSTYRCPFDPRSVSDGTFNFDAVCTDTSNNSATSSSRSYTVSPPKFIIVAAPPPPQQEP
jgi:hypothetical protein